jgi:Transposase DDE domain
MVRGAGVEVRRCIRNADLEVSVPPDLDALLTALYVELDDSLPRWCGPGRKPRSNDAEIICLAVAQVLLDCPGDRRFLAIAGRRLAHLFPHRPQQPGYHKRVRRLTPLICQSLERVAWLAPSSCDQLRLLDSTPVPCAHSRQTVQRSALAGHAGYGWCAAHSRYFWGFRLYIIATPDGMPFGFELAAANEPERVVAAELLERVARPGHTIITDKGFAGHDFEQLVLGLGCHVLRPDRHDEPRRHGHLGAIRQWIEAIIGTYKSHLSLERHGARTLPGICARIGQRLLALAACVWHNHLVGHHPVRSTACYDH